MRARSIEVMSFRLAEETDVPCGTCTACCSSKQNLPLYPSQGDVVESYQVQVAIDAAGNSAFSLAQTPSGACVYLGASGCTIYQRRPFLCRSFDCRKHYLILPRQDRDNLVRLGLSSRAVFNAGRARLKTLSSDEREECLKTSEEYFGLHAAAP